MRSRPSRRESDRPPARGDDTARGESRLSPRVVFAGFLVLATIVAYVPAIRSGYIWDDDFYVTQNPTLRDGAGLKRIWLETDANPQYYPLTFTTFWLEYHLWELRPMGYHLVNVLLHAASALVLWRILALLRMPGSALAASIFALHPIQVESVAWITERKNVLAGLLCLCAALAYLRFALESPDESAGRRGGSRLGREGSLPALALLLFCGSLLSKSVTASLPVALAIVIVWKRGRLERRHLPWLGGMLACGAAMGMLTALLERRQVGAEGAEWSLTIVERCLLAGRVFWFYPAKLAWPANLSFVYPRWTIDSGAAWQYLFAVAAVALFVLLVAWRKRLGGGPLAAALYYGATISPVLGFLNVFPMKYSWVADHFQYLPSIGPIALASAGLTRGWARAVAAGDRSPRWLGAPARVAAGILVLPLAVLTFAQGRSYRDEETLWRETIRRSPRAWMAQYNLANLLESQGKTEEAVRHYLLAVQANPDYVDPLSNLGTIRLHEGKLDEAIGYYEAASRRAPGNPIYRFNLGIALARAGQIERAIESFREAIRLTPDPSSLGNAMWRNLYERGIIAPPPGMAEMGLAHALAALGRRDEAIGHYRKAVEEDPDLADAWLGLGEALEAEGRLDDAAASYERVVEARRGPAGNSRSQSEARARLDAVKRRIETEGGRHP